MLHILRVSVLKIIYTAECLSGLMRHWHGTRLATRVARAIMQICRWRIEKRTLIFCEGCTMSIALEAVTPPVLGSMVNLIMLPNHGSVTRTIITLVCRTCPGRRDSRTETTPSTASSCGGQGLMVWPTTIAVRECRPFAQHTGIIFTFILHQLHSVASPGIFGWWGLGGS